ncbi:MAG TPA: AAA family ATPase, partial [Thermoanaerobaculia bacterium]|nr:AAA family ATPase [Thermoanaerobaculia bacterium]
PKAIAGELARRVIGQGEAVRELAVALAKKLGGLRVGHILMIGSSGTGKTTLMRAVEALLAARPELALRSTVVRMHANVLGEEAERGRPGEAVLWRLLDRAREQLGADASAEQLLSRAARGLVFVDEVDKIRSHVGDRPNVAGIRAQEALLTLIENEAIPMRLPEWAGGGVTTVDSSGLLFVCAGAFEGLYESVYDRVTVGRDRGSLRATTTFDSGKVQEQLNFSLRDWLRNEDLFDYGMSPQFLSRFDAVVLLHDLVVDDLVRIFLEAPESGYAVARQYFAQHGKRLTLSPAAVRRIAAEAARQPRLGARALKEVFRRVIRDYEIDPEAAAPGPGTALVIDLPEVEAALRRE